MPISPTLTDLTDQLRDVQTQLEGIGMDEESTRYHLLAGASVSIQAALDFIQKAIDAKS